MGETLFPSERNGNKTAKTKIVPVIPFIIKTVLVYKTLYYIYSSSVRGTRVELRAQPVEQDSFCSIGPVLEMKYRL